MKIGFVGTGSITEAMVTGILAAPPLASEIVVSPRNANVASRLATRFEVVRIGSNNQAVVDGSDMLILAIRPQIAEEIVRELRFRPAQIVVSVVAAADRRRLLDWIGTEVRLVQAIPLPFVAERDGVTAIYPPNEDVASVFASLGTAVECESREEYDLLAAASALMATYFGILERTTGWLADRGLPRRKAKAYLTPLFAKLSQTALSSDTTDFEGLNRAFATKGGINEQALAEFERNGGSEALTRALDHVLARIKQ